MADPHATTADAPPPNDRRTGSGRRPRLPSPTEPVEVVRRPESDPDLWVAIATELAE